jgi:negative regulator of flagellin synthesis FlgM
MAIDSIGGRIPNNPATTKLTAQNSTQNQTVQSGAIDKVETQITDKIKTALASSTEPPVNSERVTNIRQAIADGSYQVNADRVAAKMLQFEKSLPDNTL